MSDTALTTISWAIGEAGQRMADLGAAEGAAGNISVFARELPPSQAFRPQHQLDLPVAVPALAGGWLVMTGSQKRLRDVARSPEATLCLLQIEPDGSRAMLHAATPLRPTSEWNTHLAVHNDAVDRHNLDQHAVVHAQPVHLTYLSHLEQYTHHMTFSRRLLRWQPESIMEFPEGIGTLPFEMPGSQEQMRATVEAMRLYRVVVWQRHGIVTRAADVLKAADLVEYAEAAARYEVLNMQQGEPSNGLSDNQIRLIADRLGIEQHLF